MNCPQDFMDKINYPILLGECGKGGKHVYRYGENLYICNTYQFDDYSAMAVDMFKEEDKRAYRDAHFEEDLNRSKELAKRLVAEVKERLGI